MPAQQPEVCADHERGAALAARGVYGAELIELMGLDQEEFSRRLRKSPVKRAKRRGLLRNVAVALGNWGAPEAVPVLAAALDDAEPLIRGHAAWALVGWAMASHLKSTLVLQALEMALGPRLPVAPSV